MKKTVSFLLSIIIVLSLLPACKKTENSGKIKIITTIFPVFDWVREIVGENSDVQISMLLDNGVDLHSFQPTADDIVNINTCDLFIFAGGESDEWARRLLSESDRKINALNLMDALGEMKKEEAHIEGMEEEHEEDEKAPEYDEHIWLSLKNAEVLVRAIGDKLSDICGNTEEIKKNTEDYISRLRELDTAYSEVISSSKRNTLLFADRFPFMYLTDDYGLNYYAAFSGCSAESEASFETITFLAKKIGEESLTSVIILDGSSEKIADTVISASENKDCSILTMNSMQSITKKDASGGNTYLNYMKTNLETLRKALN